MFTTSTSSVLPALLPLHHRRKPYTDFFNKIPFPFCRCWCLQLLPSAQSWLKLGTKGCLALIIFPLWIILILVCCFYIVFCTFKVILLVSPNARKRTCPKIRIIRLLNIYKQQVAVYLSHLLLRFYIKNIEQCKFVANFTQLSSAV